MTNNLVSLGSRIRNLWRWMAHRTSSSQDDNIQGIILSTKRYVRADLCEHFNIPPQAPIRIELPVKGRRNLLWMVTLEETKYMLHCFLSDQKQRMGKHVTALRLMEENGVRGPRLLHTTDSSKKYGVYFAASEFVEGEGRGGNQKLSPSEVKCLAEQAGKLHSIHNSMWGPLDSPGSDDYFAHHMRQINRYLSRARKSGKLTREQYEQVRTWFQNWENQLARVTQYSLIHGDLHPNNVLFQPDGTCCLVDTDQFAWNLGMLDVALIHDRACRGDAERIRIFDEAYLSRLDEQQKEQHLTLYPFFAAYYRLGAVMRAVRLVERKKSSITTPRALKKDIWKEMLDICAVK